MKRTLHQSCSLFFKKHFLRPTRKVLFCFFFPSPRSRNTNRLCEENSKKTSVKMRLFKAQTGGTDQIRAALVSSPGLLGFLRPCYLHIAEPEDEWDANLSWHVKLWLDQITRRSSVNGWAPTFAFRHWRLHRIGLPCTSLWPCPSPSLGRLADKIIAGFQSNITWDFFFYPFFSAFVSSLQHLNQSLSALSDLSDSSRYRDPFSW